MEEAVDERDPQKLRRALKQIPFCHQPFGAWSPVHKAAAMGQDDILSLFVCHGYSTCLYDVAEDSPMFWAILNGHHVCIELLFYEPLFARAVILASVAHRLVREGSTLPCFDRVRECIAWADEDAPFLHTKLIATLVAQEPTPMTSAMLQLLFEDCQQHEWDDWSQLLLESSFSFDTSNLALLRRRRLLSLVCE